MRRAQAVRIIASSMEPPLRARGSSDPEPPADHFGSFARLAHVRMGLAEPGAGVAADAEVAGVREKMGADQGVSYFDQSHVRKASVHKTNGLCG
jgi:hypothetical protein